MEVAGNSDLIVIGTVTDLIESMREPENPVPAYADYMAGEAVAVISVKRTIKGRVGASFKMRYPTPPRKGGMSWGVTLHKGETRIWCLDLLDQGYALCDSSGLMEANKASKIAGLVRDFPVRVCVERFDQLTLGQPSAMLVSISNVGNWPVEYQSLRLTGRIAGKAPPPETAKYVEFESDPPMSYLEEPKSTIEPGQTTLISLKRIPKVTQATESAFVAAGKEVEIQMAASVFLKIIAPEDKSADPGDNLPITEGFHVTTPWRNGKLKGELKSQ